MMLSSLYNVTIDLTLETIAFVFGILSVWLARKEHIYAYPTGIIATAITAYLLLKAEYFGDMIVNCYFTLMSFYGWIAWKKAQNNSKTEILHANRLDWAIVSALFFITIGFVLFAYVSLNTEMKIENYFDVLAAAIFFSAMYLMAHKRIENWQLWIIGNLIVIPLYFYRELYFLGAQYIIFNYLAIQAFFEWKRKLSKTQPIVD